MKRTIVALLPVAVTAAALFSCGEKENDPGDLDIAGNWVGAIAAIPLAKFNGAKIYADFNGQDSTFLLVTRDTTLGTASAIKDTSLVLEGSWSLTARKDSVLLACDTGKIIDTAQSILKPVSVQGQVIPVYTKTIAANAATGTVEWNIAFSDFLPLAPLLGITIPDGIDPSVWQAVRILMIKIRQ